MAQSQQPTPVLSHHDEIDSIIRSLNDVGMRLPLREKDCVPSQRLRSIENTCVDTIQYCYFRRKLELYQNIEEFKASIMAFTTLHRLHCDDKAMLLLGMFTQRLEQLKAAPKQQIDSTAPSTILESSQLYPQLPSSQELIPYRTRNQFEAVNLQLSLQNSHAVSFDEDTLYYDCAANEPPPDPIFESSQEPSTPRRTLEHHAVRDLPNQGLPCGFDSNTSSTLSYHIKFECARYALVHELDLSSVISPMLQNFSNHNDLRKYLTTLMPTTSNFDVCNSEIWDCAKDEFDGVTFRAALSLSQRSTGRVFQMQLQPLAKEMSCRFQRAFGSDRFLYVSAPILENNQLPEYLKDQSKHLEKRFQEWLMTEKQFLGRTWRCFYIRKKDRAKKPGGKGRYEVILFAVDGDDLRRDGRPHVAIEDLILWFLPLSNCKHLKFCKAYARLELGLSKTQPTAQFNPDQMLDTNDMLSTKDPIITSFRDDSLSWSEIDDFHDEKVMNDGCAIISKAAMRHICKARGLIGILPSVFQGRIAGAKGLWSVSLDEYHDSFGPDDLWIQLTASQRKFDLSPDNRDVNHRTFELLRFSRPLSSGSLHLGFLPILEDRGVSTYALSKYIKETLVQEERDLFTSLNDSQSLLRWIYSQDNDVNWTLDSPDSAKIGGMPLSNISKLKLLLESGFEPTSSKYVGKLVHRIVEEWCESTIKKLRVKVGRSTVALAIADPLGILNPGEIHLAFSNNFVDERSGFCQPFLNELDVLLSRDPCFRVSDVQKVKAVYKAELGDLKDVLVFPSKGGFPLAGMMQGGDYDGDRFWVCWEPALVNPFRNAPPPMYPSKPEDFGIRVAKTTIGDLFDGSHDAVDRFLSKSFDFALKENLLGEVSRYHERLAYSKNSLTDSAVVALACLREHLLDAAKQGHEFDRDDWQIYKRNNGLGPMKKTAYEAVASEPKERHIAIKIHHPPKREHIVDYVRFWIIEPWQDRLLNTICQRNKKMSAMDDDLTSLWLSCYELPDVKEELDHLSKTLARLGQDYKDKVAGLMGTKYLNHDRISLSKACTDCIKDLNLRYQNIDPLDMQNPMIRSWATRYTKSGPTTWDLLKASSLFQQHHRHETLVFGLAGQALCYMKSWTSPDSHTIIPSIWSQMKPKKLPRSFEEDDSSESGEAFDENEIVSG